MTIDNIGRTKSARPADHVMGSTTPSMITRPTRYTLYIQLLELLKCHADAYVGKHFMSLSAFEESWTKIMMLTVYKIASDDSTTTKSQ